MVVSSSPNRFHHDDCTYEDILSETDFGRFMGAGSLRLDPPVEEDKSTVASAAEKKRPKVLSKGILSLLISWDPG